MTLSYKEVMQGILKKYPNLHIHGYSDNKIVRSKAMQIEMKEDHHEKRFLLAVSSLQPMLKEMTEPEYVKSLEEYLERKHPEVKFYRGIIFAACFHLNCITRYEGSHNVREGETIFHNHTGWSIVPSHILYGGKKKCMNRRRG